MAKKQTRKSISANCNFFDRLQRYCDQENVPMSSFVEFVLDGNMSTPIDTAAYERWRVTYVRRVMATRDAAMRRAKHAAGLARVRASAERDNSSGKNGDES